MIPLAIPHMTGDEWEKVKKCFDDNWVSSAGPDVKIFGGKFSEYVSSDYAVPLASGTAALHLALKAVGVKSGDKVLVPSLTFIASVNPIKYCNAEPVFIDSEVNSYNIDPQKTVKKIENMVSKGDKPRAIIVVHLYGHPADIEPILDLCNKYNIKVIEDATEALGSKYKGEMVGSLGDIGCFSFNGNKLITTGGGGMLVTNNKEYAKYVKYLSTQAKDDPKNYIHKEIGYNYRLTNIQAAMGIAQLEHINDFIKSKRNTASKYNEAFSKIQGIKINPEEDWAFNCSWLYSILVDENKFGMNSKTLLNKLRKKGIGARPFWKPIHTMPMYEDCDSNIKNANKLWEKGINLPCSVGIPDVDINYVIEKIKDIKEDLE